MLDIAFVRENKDLVLKNNQRRGFGIDLDRLLDLDAKRRGLILRLDNLRAERNRLSRTGGRDSDRARGRVLKHELDALEQKLKPVAEELFNLQAGLPNLLDQNVPDGKTEEENKIIKTVGSKRAFDFEPKDHLDLGRRLDLIDIERAAKVAGARFYYLKNQAVRFRFGLINLAFEKLENQGFIPILTPHLARAETLFGTGYLPFFPDEQFKIEAEDLNLIGTSEQTIVGYRADEELASKDLPLKYVGYSSCFRKEAGSYGKDQRGIFRVHEFAKVEMIVFTKPADSADWHQKILKLEEEILEILEIPYQVVEVCAGDLGAAGARKFDINGWFPGQNKFRELTSNTNLTDFQTRRLKIRMKDEGGTSGEAIHPHTISATAVTDRLLLAILENHQQKDGSIEMPKGLVPYLGFEKISR